jgi:2OG-Fe(II) oxygenase superfamily
MTETVYYKEDIAYKHWNEDKLEAYIHKNVLSDNLFEAIKKNVKSILNTSTDTFLTHNTIFSLNNQTKKIISHKQNAREQHVIFDLTFDSEYYFQTVDTIKEWTINKLQYSISPVFYKFIKIIENLEPFKNNLGVYLPLRQHINVLKYGSYLGYHRDTSNAHFKTADLSKARCYSLSFYLEDHIEGYGGELYTLNNFVYKPVANSAIVFNGNQIMHGVTQNKNPNKTTRLAFTIRYAHKDDLFLPGHPDKHLWKMEHL